MGDILTRFFLVRHGETIWNAKKKYQGQSDIPLTEEGRFQAGCLADKLKDEKLDGVFASDLKRTIETAEIIAKPHDLKVVPTKMIRELSFGIWEGLTYEEIMEKWAQEYQNWINNPYYTRPPEGESLSELCQRVSKFLMETAKNHPDGRILVVSHAGPIRAMLFTLLDLKPSFFWKFKISNTSLTIIEYDGRKELKESDAFIVTVNNTSHLGII